MLLQPRVPVYTDYFTGFHSLIALNAERHECKRCEKRASQDPVIITLHIVVIQREHF